MDSETCAGFLQFADGLLPVGSYAHSFGLESYTSAGIIYNADGLEVFLRAHLQGSVAPCDVVAMLCARRAALHQDGSALEQCFLIDLALDAMKPTRETRDASRQMGRQVLRIATNLGAPFTSHDLPGALFHAIESESTPGHHAVAIGAVGAVLGWPEADMACSYLYSTCSGLVAAALRLMPLGQLAGQRVLWNLRPEIGRLAEEAQGKGMADIWSFAPALEIAAMRHATLDARLFRS